MITQEQYDLLVIAEQTVKAGELHPRFDSVMPFMCVYEYIDTRTTHGVEQKPYLYGLNSDGIDAKALYERKRDKLVKHKQQRKEIKALCTGHKAKQAAVCALITGFIGLFFYFIKSFI